MLNSDVIVTNISRLIAPWTFRRSSVENAVGDDRQCRSESSVERGRVNLDRHLGLFLEELDV